MAHNTEFVVMTTNAGGGRRARGTQLDPKQIASDLYQLTSTTLGSPDSPIGMPDIIAVQESHQVWRPRQSLPLETSQELEQKLGTSYCSYFSEYLDSDSHAHPNKWRADGPFAGFERVKQGNAVITNKSLAQWPWDLPPAGCPGYNKLAPISTQISGATLYSTGNRDTEPRNLIVVPLSLGQGVSLYFMATHLTTLTGEDRHDHKKPRSKEASDVRLAQVKEILRIADKLREAERKRNDKKPDEKSAPIILAGDFNATPSSPEINRLQQRFSCLPHDWHDKYDKKQAPLVYTHIKHKILVDYIFYNDPAGLLTPIDCLVLDPSQVGTITDHLPVVAKFQI